MIPKVKEIQVCGGNCYGNLYDACREYVRLVDEGAVDRYKLNFTILTSTGIKAITIREDDDLVAYGDFTELPNFLEYAQESLRHNSGGVR